LFLELVYIAMTGHPATQLHNDIAEYRSIWPTQAPDDARASLIAWARAMAAELSSNGDAARLEAEVVSYGAFLVAKTKIDTCEHFGDRKGAEKVRAALR